MIHLLVFLILSLILILAPAISTPEVKDLFFRIYRSGNKVSILDSGKLFSIFLLFMNLFGYLFQNFFAVHFFWTSSFISWIIGCCFWVLKLDFVSLIFISVSSIFGLLAIYGTSGFKLSGFYAFGGGSFNSSFLVLIITISVLVMVFSNTIADGLTSSIFLLIVFHSFRKPITSRLEKSLRVFMPIEN